MSTEESEVRHTRDDPIQKFADLADRRIEQVWNTHQTMIRSLTAILVLGIAIASYLFWGSRSEMQRTFETQLEQIRAELEQAQKSLEEHADSQLAELKTSMEASAQSHARALTISLSAIAVDEKEVLFDQLRKNVARELQGEEFTGRIERAIDASIGDITLQKLEENVGFSINEKFDRLDDDISTLGEKVSYSARPIRPLRVSPTELLFISHMDGDGKRTLSAFDSNTGELVWKESVEDLMDRAESAHQRIQDAAERRIQDATSEERTEK